MTELAPCEVLAWRGGGKALLAAEGKAAVVMAKPANSRRLRRVMLGGVGTVGFHGIGAVALLSSVFLLTRTQDALCSTDATRNRFSQVPRGRVAPDIRGPNLRLSKNRGNGVFYGIGSIGYAQMPQHHGA